MAASVALHGLLALWLLFGQRTSEEYAQTGDGDIVIVALSNTQAVEPERSKLEQARVSNPPVRADQHNMPQQSPMNMGLSDAQPEAVDPATTHVLQEVPAKNTGLAIASADKDGPYSAVVALSDGEGETHRIRHHLERYKFYPASARRRGIGGSVEVGFQLDRKGHAQGVIVMAGSGYSLLDWAAKETVKRAEPFPAVGGEYRFTLQFNKL